jgi:hypothetical protein
MPAGKNIRFAAAPHVGQGAPGLSRIVCHISNSVEHVGQRYPYVGKQLVPWSRVITSTLPGRGIDSNNAR